MPANLKQLVDGFVQAAPLSGPDEPESRFLEESVAGFEDNPEAAKYALRNLATRDGVKFFRSACGLLRAHSDAPGHQYLRKLLLEGELLAASLVEPFLYRLDQALALAQTLVQVDPLLDLKLTRLVCQGADGQADQIEAAKAQRALEIVGALPAHTRVLPFLLKLSRCPHARVRSRAISLFGRTTANMQWAERGLRDRDARVRANTVESLWRVDSAECRGLLLEAARDTNHRVVANALVGLYYLAGKAAASALQRMAAHPSPKFRSAAAFAMGQTLDPVFVPLLSSMAKQDEAGVRASALRALVRIRKQTGPLPPPADAESSG